MRWLPIAPRPLVQVTSVLAVLVTGCPSDPSAADGSDDLQACFDPGSPLLDNTKPAAVPGPDAPPFTCGTGWATDAPQLSPTWTIQLPSVLQPEFGFTAVQVDGYPAGGVAVAGIGLFARYDEEGIEVWNVPDAVPPQSQFLMVVEEAGTIVLVIDDGSTVNRYAGDGTLIGPVVMPWNDASGGVWALATNGPELIIGGFDKDAMGSWENTLLRLDADGNVLLRKSTSMTNSGLLAVNDNAIAAFGSFPPFTVALEDGAVLGSLTPSNGGSVQLAGYGDGFVMVGSAGADLSVGRYSETGAELWLQTYDRAAINDFGRAIDVGPDGSIVAAGTTGLLGPGGNYWYETQPWVVGVDADGNAVWADRISAVGDASSVAFGSNGEVYVGGGAEVSDGSVQPPMIGWLRRYDP